MPSNSALALSSPPANHPHGLFLLERMAPLRNLISGSQSHTAPGAGTDRRLTRLLVNVTVDRSLWPLHVVLGADATVADLVRAAVEAYEREGRRPPLPRGGHGGDAKEEGFELHLSKYSLESLRPEEKVMDLGSRNFFLCPRRPACFV